MRTLADALANANRLAAEIPHLVQPEATAFDMVILATELTRLQAEQVRLREALKPFAEHGRIVIEDREHLNISDEEMDKHTLLATNRLTIGHLRSAALARQGNAGEGK